MLVSANGDLSAHRATYTGSQNDEFILEQVSGNVESNMVALKASNGLYASTTGESDSLTAESSSIGLNETFQWYELPNDDVALRSVSSGHLVQTVSSSLDPDGDNANTSATNYAFVDGTAPSDPPPDPEPEPEPDPGPYFGTPMAIPGVIEAKDFDYGGEGFSMPARPSRCCSA